ncbi:MAG: nodulation protein NfeD [Gammaproteobacteria bacterium]
MFKRRHLVIVLLAIAIGLLLLMVSTQAFNNNLPVIENTQSSSPGQSEFISVRRETEPLAWLLQIDGAIGPATSDYVVDNLAAAREANARILVLSIDTPGGLDSSMREIIRAILDSPIPVASFVSPQGARAASAGTYILYASHIAAMAPATNLGAATPVQIGGGIGIPKPDKPADKQDDSAEPVVNAMEKKSVNDAAAYIRSLAKLRGRNMEWAEQAVREASSLPAHEALQMNVIDLMADNVADLLQKIDGRQLLVQGHKIELETASISIEEIQPDWRNRFLSVITDPNVAYILMLIGVYGLFLEFYSPGGIVPGVAGAISLLIALYAFQVLPVNYAGLALIGLGMVLMVMEAFIPSTGILGIGGVVSFVVGSVILMDTESEAFQIAVPLIIAVAAFSVLLLVMVFGMLIRSRRVALVSGESAMLNEKAEVMEDFVERGLVRVHGELWQAVTEQPVKKGQLIPIKAINGLKVMLNNTEITTGERS